jgi:tetratricopeptide (TPR) repeat protein
MEGRAMTCEDVTRNETVEKYLLDQLGDDAREAFERHYFECGRCFGLLQTYRAVQEELARTRNAALVEAPKAGWVWRWAWAPAMAVLFFAVSIGLWQRPLREMVNPPPPEIPPTSASAPSPPPPSPPPPSTPAVTLADLARVEPPKYAPGRLRGTADETTRRFQEAMEQYQLKDYVAAVTGLSTAADLDPEAPHIGFFLGVSCLLAGQAAAAIEELRRTIELGDSPYLEEAHFYLAKTYLQIGNVGAAVKELERTIQLKGERVAEARVLLTQLQTITAPAR